MKQLQRKVLYDQDLERLKNLNIKPRVVDREAVHCLYMTGDVGLLTRVRDVGTTYPDLGFRAYKAGAYVHHQRVTISLSGRVARMTAIKQCRPIGFATVTNRAREAYMVRIAEAGIMLCTCRDFQFNLKGLPLLKGPYQQPCAHIIAASLNDRYLLSLFLVVEGVDAYNLEPLSQAALLV